jgi:serine/threonine protein kinase
VTTSPPAAEPARDVRRPEVMSLFTRSGDPLPEPLREATRRVAWRLFVEGEGTGGAKLPLALGQRVGPYRALRLLGQGGQGWVYEAVHEQLEKRVALKVPRPELADRLLAEARLAARLSHPRIVQVQDVVTDAPLPYMVMELCPGGSLEQRLELHPEGLPLEEARRVVEAVLEALAFAHARGVVHRDVKPGNVLFDERDQPRLADLGTGAVAHVPDLQHSVAPTGGDALAIEGTPLYMAPEQERPALLAGAALDGRADLFALGKLLYRLLTGSSPATVRPVSRVRPELDPAWDELLFRLLEEDRERRPASAEAALAELRRLPGPRPARVELEVRPRPTPPPPPPRPALSALSAWSALSWLALFGLAFLEVRHPTWGASGAVFFPFKLGVALVALALRWFHRCERRLREPTPLPHALLLGGLVGGWLPLLYQWAPPHDLAWAAVSFPELSLLGLFGTAAVALVARLQLFRGRVVIVRERAPGERLRDAAGLLGLWTLAGGILVTALVLALVMAARSAF